MKRVEIIANQSIEEDIKDVLSNRGVAQRHTVFHGVHGQGHTGARMGDSVWPEENIVMIVYCDKEEARIIIEAIEETKERFPNEGLQVFAMDC